MVQLLAMVAGMAEPRRSILKRVVLWTVAAVLLLAGYVASAPVVIAITDAKYPAALPVLDSLYAPCWFYARNRDFPRSTAYNKYGEWVLRRFWEEGIYDRLKQP